MIVRIYPDDNNFLIFFHSFQDISCSLEDVAMMEKHLSFKKLSRSTRSEKLTSIVSLAILQ